MDLINRNKHLNVFNYYNYSDKHDSKENNLSRSLAITLSNDRKFLNDIFKLFTLDDSYSELYSLDYDLIENKDIYIDIQKPSDSEELVQGISDKSYKNYIGVLLGNFDGKIIENKKEIENIEANNTENPIPDIIIAIKDTLIIIEAKLGGSKNNIGQLKGQVESILDNSENTEEIRKDYKIIDWEDILKLAMKYTSNGKTKENLLAYDFVDFVRKHFTNLMPVIPLKEIDIADSINDHNKNMINQRIEILKTIITQREKYFNEDELLYENGRGAIPIKDELEWAKEANISFNDNNKSLEINIWPADTKNQGWKIYKDNNQRLEWINNEKIIVNNTKYNLTIEPYIKFASTWGSRISDIRDTLNEDKKYKKTHNYRIFNKMAGQWKRNENDRWIKNNLDLENEFDKLVGEGWKNDCSWDEKFIDSNRSVVNISFGVNVEVEIPYSKAKKLDDEKDDPKLAEEIYNILMGLKEMIDQ